MAGYPPDAIDRHIAARLRAERLRAGLLQKDLAEAIGVTVSQYQKYEGGHNRLTASALWVCARRLNLPIQQFFEGADGDAE